MLEFEMQAVEYQGHIYRLRYESSSNNRGGQETTRIDKIYLDVYKYIDRASTSEKSCLKIFKSNLVKQCGAISGYSINAAENVGDDNQVRSLYIVLQLIRNNQHLLNIFRVDTQSLSVLQCKKTMISRPLFTSNHFPAMLSGPILLSLARKKYVSVISCVGDACEQVFEIEKPTSDVMFAVTLSNCFSDHQWVLIATRTTDDILLRKFCFNLGNGSVSSITKLPSLMFFPDEYKELVATFCVKFTKDVHSNLVCIDQECFKDTEVLKKNSTCVCTKAKQFLVFVGGAIKYCCKIPFPDVNSICELRQYQPANVSLILKSTSGIVLLQKNKSTLKIQVTEVWKGYLLSFFGDFQKTGKQVLVFLTDDTFGTEITDFKLSEIFLPGITEEKKTVLSGLKENTGLMNTLMLDLRRRVSTGQAALTRMEEKLQDKRKVLDTAMLTIQDTTRTGKLDIGHQQISLVDVALGFQSAGSLSDTPKAMVAPEYALQLLTQWQTFLKEHWILGIMFKNVSKSCVQKINCTLLACEQILESQQLIFTHPETETEPLLRDFQTSDPQIAPGQTASLLVAVKMPLISKDCLRVPTVVSWEVMEKDPFWQQVSQQVQLRVEDLTDKRNLHFEELSQEQQLLCFRVLQTPVSLLVKSEISHLKELGLTLEAGTEDGPVAIIHGGAITYLFRAQASPLWGVNFSYAGQERTQGQIVVFCSTSNQLLLFVHWLYPKLNPDAVILPQLIPEPSCKRLWKSMGKELEFVLKNLANCSRETSKKTFANMREQCSYEQKQLENKIEEWTFDEYRQFRCHLSEHEKVTDDYFRDML